MLLMPDKPKNQNQECGAEQGSMKKRTEEEETRREEGDKERGGGKERQEEGKEEERGEEEEAGEEEEEERDKTDREWRTAYQNIGGGIEATNILLARGRQDGWDFV